MSANAQDIVIPDRDRDKSYIGKFSEVIRQVMMETSDGSKVVIDMENLGSIEVIPWSSEHQPGDIFGTAEDRVTFSPVSGHDVMILELMAEHARKFNEIVIAEMEQAEAKEQKTTTEQKKPNGKPPQIVAGGDEGLNRFALR